MLIKCLYLHIYNVKKVTRIGRGESPQSVETRERERAIRQPLYTNDVNDIHDSHIN